MRPMFYRIVGFIGFIVVWLMVYLSLASAVHADTVRIGPADKWGIEFHTHMFGGSCSAASGYFGGKVMLSFLYAQKDGEKVWFFHIKNKDWSWIKKDEKYEMVLNVQRTSTKETKHLSINLYGASPNTLVAMVDKDTVNAMATDYGDLKLNIYHPTKGTRLFNDYLNLGKSAIAIRAVVNCLKERNPVAENTTPSTPTQKPQQPSQKKEGVVYTGTGFFINGDHVLTNWHTFDEGCNKILVKYPETRAGAAYIVAKDTSNDLALLKTTEFGARASAEFKPGVRLGAPIYSFGYPLSGILSTSGNFTLGNVTSMRGAGDNSSFFQMSAPIQPGNSGGPVMDQTGSVVGITTLRGPLEIVQNVGFAIHSSITLHFLNVNGVIPKMTDAHAPILLDPSDIAEKAQKFTVQVICQ